MIPSEIEKLILSAQNDFAYNGDEWAQRYAKVAKEFLRYSAAFHITEWEIEQRIAALFPEDFPEYPEDWGTDDRCVGDHTSVSLVMYLINEYQALQRQLLTLLSHQKVTIDTRSQIRDGVPQVQIKTPERHVTGSTIGDAIIALGAL